MGFRLRILAGKGAGREFHFHGATVRIGRTPSSDLVLYDTGVSREHCQISLGEGGFILRDTGSANGTLVNDVPTFEARIGDGDRIQIGGTTFEFCAKEAEPSDAVRAMGLGRHDFAVPMDNKDRRAARRNAKKGPTPEVVNATARRTRTGTFLAPRRRWVGELVALPKRNRWVLGLGLALVLGGALLASYRLSHPPVADRSNDVFAIDERMAQRSFGLGKVDVGTADRVNFSFTQHGGRVTVYYTAGGIESAQAVQIFLNSRDIGYVPVSGAGWTRGLRLVLPRRFFRPGTNLLTFDNRANPPGQQHWGIAEVALLEEPLPPPDLTKAQQYYELGRIAYETRSVTPQNLARAISYFEQARRYIEAAEPEAPLLGTIAAGLTRAQEELQTVFDGHIFAAEKAAHFGDAEAAAESLRELLRYFPSVDDPRNRDIKDRLVALTGQSVP